MLPATSRWRAAATADVALPPEPLTLPLTLPLPPRRRQAAADVVLSRCRHRRSICAATTALLPARCAPPPRFALPPPPLTLPPPPCRRQASADVALARCRHRRRRAVALPPPPQPPRCYHRVRHLRFALPPPPPRRRQFTADVALSRCRHRRSLHATTTALLPSRCAPPPCFALPHLPLLGDSIRQSHDVSQLCAPMRTLCAGFAQFDVSQKHSYNPMYALMHELVMKIEFFFFCAAR